MDMGLGLSLEMGDGADKIISDRKTHQAELQHRMCCLTFYHMHRVGFPPLL